MNDQETLRTLAMLRYADAETVRMFDLAFPRFVDEPMSEQLQQFRDDHQAHVERLNAALGRWGHVPPDPPHEFMALVQEHLGMVDRAADNDQTLAALLMSERMILAEYEQAAGADMADDLAAMAREHHGDEQRHVGYLEQRRPVMAGVGAGAAGGAGSGGLQYSSPHEVRTMGVGTGGSLGGMGSGAAPKPPRDRSGQACGRPGEPRGTGE